jgi:peptide/nickel transport system permease protein
MATYVLRRLIQAIPILVGISIVSFAIVHLAPGDPVDRFRSGRVSQQVIQNLIRLYGLDKPILEQFTSWFTAFWQFPWKPEAWGYSFLDGRPVTEKVAEKVPTTLLLMGTSLAVTAIIAVPSFVLGILLLFIFNIRIGTGPLHFPGYGLQTLGKSGDVGDVAWHLVLPVSSLAIQQIAGWSRYMRSSMLEVLQQDYMRTAKAKGLRGSRVLFKHGLRNALIPIITLLGLTLPSLLGGAAITETIFSWPGLGFMAVQSVGTNDYPVVLAIVMIGGAMVILGNLVADVLYGLVDPRIKY